MARAGWRLPGGVHQIAHTGWRVHLHCATRHYDVTWCEPGGALRVACTRWRVPGGTNWVARTWHWWSEPGGTWRRVPGGAYEVPPAGAYRVARTGWSALCGAYWVSRTTTLHHTTLQHRTGWRVPGRAYGRRVPGGVRRLVRAGWRVPGGAYRVVRTRRRAPGGAHTTKHRTGWRGHLNYNTLHYTTGCRVARTGWRVLAAAYGWHVPGGPYRGGMYRVARTRWRVPGGAYRVARTLNTLSTRHYTTQNIVPGGACFNLNYATLCHTTRNRTGRRAPAWRAPGGA